ncbi:glucose-1-phosphate thymidylyltransferase [Streptomyces sp. NPDC000410]|uniref:glucose-1-phosphate thymidylyltransferase n=1 Tax=Streptomyces sp. NPDC000410 TaxID=3154254 RepID=UPI00332DD5E0
MKALVLAGGSGTRLRPLSYSMPKQLVPVANRPVLEHVLENIRELGVTETGIVVGDWAAAIQEVLGDGSRLGLRLSYLRQEKPLGLAHCVILAREFLADDDFVLHLGDVMLPDGVRDAAGTFAARGPAAHVVVQKVADPRACGVAEVAADGTVLGLEEKPAHPRGDLALTGVYFLTRAIHRAVAAIGPSARGELEITDAIQWLVSAGERVTADTYDGYWRDTGRIGDVLACNRELLDRAFPRRHDVLPVVAGSADRASSLTGPVVIEAGARVVRSHLTGPVVVGAGSLVEDSRLGPYTSVGRDCVLTRVRGADCITLDGARVVGGPALDSTVVAPARTPSRAEGAA